MPRTAVSILAFLLVPGAALLGPGHAQQRPPTTPFHLRVPVNLVLLNVRVSHVDGQVPLRLDPFAFTVLEDGKPQDVRIFENPQSRARVGLVLDVSGSTREKIMIIRDACQQFLGQVAEQDEVSILTVGSAYEVAETFTDDRRRLQRVVRRLHTQPGRGTQLYDALEEALERLRPYQGRSLLVVFSDGMDTNSQLSYDALRQRVLRGGSAIYAISLNTLEDERRRLEGHLAVAAAVPKHFVIVQDLSQPSADGRALIHDAAQAFLEALRPRDRVSLLQYRANDLFLLAESDSPEQAQRRLEETAEAPAGRRIEPGGATFHASTLLYKGTGENLVVFTDRERSGVDALAAYDVPLERANVLPVSTPDPAELRSQLSGLIYSDLERHIMEDLEILPAFFAQSQARLRQLAEESGGRYLLLEDITGLGDAYAAIVQELRHSYLLGYYSRAGSGYHRLEVRLDDLKLRARTRRGFFIPFESGR